MRLPIVQDILDQVEHHASLRAMVSFAGHAATYSTNAPDHLEWLCRYTATHYRIVAPAGAPVAVSSYDDGAFERQTRRRLERLARTARSLYQGYPAREADLGDGWTALLHTSRPSIILLSPRRARCITLGTPSDPESKLEPIRCLREIFTKTVERDGRFVFHAGGVTIGGHGVGICGEKGSGKSTAVVGMVAAGASFLTNDRSYVGTLDDELLIHPWPTTAPIAMGTLYRFPALRRRHAEGTWSYEPQEAMTATAQPERLATLSPAELAALPDKLQLTSAELAHSLGSTVAEAAPLACLVLPRIDLARRDVVIEETPRDTVAELLLNECFTPRDESYPDWLRWRTATEQDLARSVRALVARVAEEVPCFTLHFGDLQGDPGRRVTETLLEHIGTRRAQAFGRG